MKAQVIERIKSDLGQIDLLVYSLASPVRQHPRTGVLYRSAIKPIGETYHVKTLNVDRGVVQEVDLEPATPEEIAATVAVMGGEDWEFWIEALQAAGVLAPGFRTMSYTYIGTELTWPIYWHATLGKAKEDLDRAARAITQRLASLRRRCARRGTEVRRQPGEFGDSGGAAVWFVAVARDEGRRRARERPSNTSTGCFARRSIPAKPQRLDDAQRIRMDDVELTDAIQGDVKRRWPIVDTENLATLGDLDGFRADFLKIFGFGFDGVDYDEDLDPALAEL